MWSTGSRLDGGLAMYPYSPEHHAAMTEFAQIASFTVSRPGRGRVATSSTTDRSGPDRQRHGAGRIRCASTFWRGPDLPRAPSHPPLLTTLPPLPAATAPLAGR